MDILLFIGVMFGSEAGARIVDSFHRFWPSLHVA